MNPNHDPKTGEFSSGSGEPSLEELEDQWAKEDKAEEDRAASKKGFESFIAGIKDQKLQSAVEDSALQNAGDMVSEGQHKYESQGYWEAALSTAKDLADAPEDYFPDLFNRN